MISKAVRTVAGLRWAILFALVLLVATAVPVLAESSPEVPEEAGIEQIPAPTPAEIAEAESAQREHEAWLSTPEAAQQREASQSAYDDLTASESRTLLVESFPVQLQELDADPARVISGLEIDKSLGEYAARVIDDEGDKAIIESSVPIESSLGGNGVEPVDLALESAADGFVSENPLTEVRLPGSADGAIQLEGGVSVQLPASGDHSAVPLGDEDLFYPETEPTTDTLVSTRASGVEVFEQLRSPDSPEQFSFDLGFPAGASLRENSKGGAEVVDGSGQTITEVLPPTAVDAQGATVPVTMRVEEDSLLLDVPHRNGDFAAPILVDPVFINYGASLTETTNFSSSLWPSSTSGGGYVNRNFGNGLNVYSQGSGTWLGANTHGQFAYSAPGSTAWIAAATFSELSFFPLNSCRKDEPHGYVGIFNPGSGSYVSVGDYRNGTITGASFNTGEVGNTGTRWAIFGLGTSGEGFTMNCVHEFWMGGYTIKEKDWDAPTLTSTPSVPNGWFDPSGLSESTIAATDPGFGVHDLSVGQTGGVTNHHPMGCSGAAGSRCNASVSWKTPIPYKPGERKLIVTAEDPLGSVGEWEKTTKVDAQKPEIDLHGQLAKVTEEVGLEGEENPASENRLVLPVYNLQIKAIDGKETPATERQAGVTKMEVLLDEGKEPLAKWQGACAKGYSCSHELPFQLKLTGLADGVHHLHVRATDGVNHTEEREIDFEYIPATGEDSEYVMQHFPLVDGEEQAGDPGLAVNVMNGNLVYHEQDLDLNTPSADVEVERVYNSQLPKGASSEWGSGWTLAQTPTLEPEAGGGGGGGTATRRASGVITRGVALPSESGGEKFSPTLHATVTKTPSGTYTVTDESGQTTAYDSKGLPTEVKTGEFSAINYDWEGEQLKEISVEDPAATTSSPEEVAENEGGMTEGQPAFEESFGETGAGNGQFEAPSGMALDSSGNLWVADRGNGRVERFDAEGNYLSQLGTMGSGEGQLREPAAVAVDAGGNIWVADAGNFRVQEFNGEGKYLRSVGAVGSGNGQFSGVGPQGIAVDGSGNVLVTDSGGHRVEKFDSTGKFIEAFGASQLVAPVGVSVGPSGRIWVADPGQAKVVAFKSSGQLLRSFGKEGESEGELKAPVAVAVNSSGQVFVADAANGRVAEFTETGTLLHEFGSREGAKGRFSAPMGIAVDGKGHVWVAALANSPEAEEGGEEAEPAPEEEPSESPVAAYSFDEGTGTIAHDDSAGENDGTLSNTQWVAGKYNSALKFNGESSCVTAPSSPELQLDQGLTLEAWVKSEGSGFHEPIIVKETPNFFSYAAYLGREASGKAEGIVSSAAWSWEETTSTEKVPSNTWTSLAFTDDGENLRLYVNGKLTDTAPAEKVQPSTGSLSIGCDALFGHHFKGLIDNIRIYDHAIGAGKLADDEATPVPPGDSSLVTPVAAYSFDEGTGTIAHDDSAGENGTLSNTQWVAGKYNSALKFNGESSCVTAPSSPELQLDQGLTLEAWVKSEGSGFHEPIIVKETPNFFSYAAYLGREASGKAEGIVSSAAWSWEETTSTEKVPANTWTSLAFTDDGENLRLYVNGKLTDTAPAEKVQSSTGSLSIGCDALFGHHFKGLIDNIRIYDHAIGAGKLADDESTPVPPGPRFEIERWKTTSSTPITPPEDDPRLDLSYEGKFVSAIDGEQVSTQTYDQEGDLLTARQGGGGETSYDYDAAKRLTSISLPDGTTASISYEAQLGRVASVTVQLAGTPAKTTSFEYKDEPRETIVHPPGEPVVHYQIAEDGSVFKWSNAAKPPVIEPLTGSLYFQRGEVHPEPISPGDQNLEVVAHSPEGIASIQVIANGNQVVEELTCTPEGEVSCLTVKSEYVTETESWPPGILWLEVLVTDSLGNRSSQRFWDNIPYVPPPEGEAPVPPTFAEIKRFREEFGLDLDLKSNPLARNERIFELINSWHRPGTYLGQVARSSWEQWGEPLRPVDVAELEYREWFFSVNAERIDQWVEETQPSSFAGYYIDHVAGGIMHIGFLGNQEEQLSNLSSDLSLVAQERLQIYSPAPTTPYLSVQATSEAVLGAVESNPSLKALIVSVGVDESGRVVQVGASNVAQVEGILRGILGSSAPVSVEYEAENGELLSGRFRNEGRMRAGDFIARRVFIQGGHAGNAACTAGFGAKEKAGEVGGSPVWRAFLLTAGHCTPKGQTVYRSTDSDQEDESNWVEVGEVKRNALEEFESIRTDAEAIRVKDGGVVPRAIFGFDGHPIATEPAEKARKGDVLCFSGAQTQVPQCGRIVHRSEAWVNRKEDNLPRGGYWVTFPKGAIRGDSGAPVWKRQTRAPIGQVTGKRTHGAVVETLVEPLLHPYRMPATIVPGILGNPHMGNISLMLGGD